jgi:hypothetical protein
VLLSGKTCAKLLLCDTVSFILSVSTDSRLQFSQQELTAPWNFLQGLKKSAELEGGRSLGGLMGKYTTQIIANRQFLCQKMVE